MDEQKPFEAGEIEEHELRDYEEAGEEEYHEVRADESIQAESECRQHKCSLVHLRGVVGAT